MTREIKNRKKVEDKLKNFNFELEERVEQRTAELNLASEKYISALDNMLEGCQILGKDWKYLYINDSAAKHNRRPKEELIGEKYMDMWPGVEKTEVFRRIRQCLENNIAHRMENKFIFPDGTEGYFLLSLQPIPEGVFILSVDITERKLTELRVQHLNRLYATLSEINQTIVRVQQKNELFEMICRVAVEIGQFAFAWIGQLNAETGEVIPTVVNSGNLHSLLPKTINIKTIPFKDGLIAKAFRTNQVAYSQDVQNDPHLKHWNSPVDEGVLHSAAAIPFRLKGEVYGFLNLYASEVNFFLVEEEQNLLNELSLDISFALDTIDKEERRINAENEIERQLKRLQSLRTIDLAILENNIIHQSLEMILEQILTLLQVDAADFLLFNQESDSLQYCVGLGFHSNRIQKSELNIGEGVAGKAALNKEVIHISNLEELGGELSNTNLVKQEGFIEYFAIPLINKGIVTGVLEIFNRKQVNFDKNGLDFLESLSGQAAIAIDNYQLLTGLQFANKELLNTYDKTIEGWSNALDLRDKETEGHTNRVTQMTLKLARYAGFSESELIHIKRGALLHDIGKMGIPDHILLKPGKLTEEEWVIMKKHPQFAYDLLSPITYLQPALEIPYYHHEKWDGSGYPTGLKGEEIPLAARLFSIIDVWDALTSDRPYRPAWSKDETLRYIQSLSGIHFDPYVVKIFLETKVYECNLQNCPNYI
jgi:PAS domain S-box-containing protein